jgi:hypothetical protein
MQTDDEGAAMTDSTPEKADWQGVGESFRSLGRQLKDRAVDAGTAISTANTQATSGIVDQVSTAFTTAIAKLDETTTDPEIGRATRTATARLLDAIKAELTGGVTDDAEPPADPGPAKPIEPGPTA